jgi:hypothetical protein
LNLTTYKSYELIFENRDIQVVSIGLGKYTFQINNNQFSIESLDRWANFKHPVNFQAKIGANTYESEFFKLSARSLSEKKAERRAATLAKSKSNQMLKEKPDAKSISQPGTKPIEVERTTLTDNSRKRNRDQEQWANPPPKRQRVLPAFNEDSDALI